MEEGIEVSQSKGSPTKGLLLIGLVVIAGLLFLAKGSDKPAMEANQDNNLQMVESAEVAPAIMTEDVKTFTLEAGSFYYQPNVVTVNQGDKVKIVINSVDMQHAFVIDELNIASAIAKSGESTTVEFTADTAGEFQFYCSVGTHRAQGMVGTLIVQPDSSVN